MSTLRAYTARMFGKTQRSAIRQTPAGRRLRAALALAGWTQRDLSDAVRVSESGISLIVSGRRVPTADQQKAIAAALGLSTTDLFGQEAA